MVGCGKSTLLHSMMGETKHMAGSKTVRGTVAYVEQEPFIVSASIRENIRMGKHNDPELL
jgi:ABC-type transport system involved in cytochrome bd biosynthesis fused ATPase/permease subunit